MSTTVDALKLRKVMGRHLWGVPEPFGPDGWRMIHVSGDGSVIVTTADRDDGSVWTHASIAYPHRLPSYAELGTLKLAVWGGSGYAYQVFTPTTRHVNIHNYALHLYGKADGSPALPEFSGELPGVGRSI